MYFPNDAMQQTPLASFSAFPPSGTVSPFSPPRPPGCPQPLCFPSVQLPVPGGWCKWSHTVRAVLCVASLTQHRVFQVHPRGLVSPQVSPFSGRGAPSPGGPVLVTPHPPPSVDGHVGSFYFLALVNGAAAKDGGQSFVSTSAGSSLGPTRWSAVEGSPGRPASREAGASVRSLRVTRLLHGARHRVLRHVRRPGDGPQGSEIGSPRSPAPATRHSVWCT